MSTDAIKSIKDRLDGLDESLGRARKTLNEQIATLRSEHEAATKNDAVKRATLLEVLKDIDPEAASAYGDTVKASSPEKATTDGAGNGRGAWSDDLALAFLSAAGDWMPTRAVGDAAAPEGKEPLGDATVKKNLRRMEEEGKVRHNGKPARQSAWGIASLEA